MGNDNRYFEIEKQTRQGRRGRSIKIFLATVQLQFVYQSSTNLTGLRFPLVKVRRLSSL